jgi:SAM-dependent methyltransferase
MGRYDGVADWYDAYVSRDALELTELARETLSGLLGCGAGRCLDLGCGGGVQIPHLASLGWSVVGLDVSADQLRVARGRAGAIADELVGADCGIRSRVGVRHVPLADLVNALLAAGFRLERLEEPGEHDPPILLAVAATLPAHAPREATRP